jgi:GTPase
MSESTLLPQRCGFTALIGAPNAGKSTLLNALVGEKISIVTRKAQTTRSQIRAIALVGTTQIILVDTPGLFTPKRRLERAMVASAWNGASDADHTLFLLDVRKGLNEENRGLLARLAEGQGKAEPSCSLVLNKIDLVSRESLLALAFAQTFMISALSGDGVADLLHYFAARMPEGPWLYPEDQISEAPQRFLAAEITREQIFERVHDEVPYQCTVETESWTVQKDGSIRIGQVIYVTRESQRKILLGEKGATIKAIGQAARKVISAANDTKTHLFLFVKVRESWENDPERYRMMGLDYTM